MQILNEMQKNDKIGLALSGGGYRATAYHLGTFRALKKMGLLEKINVISSNSGGSITNACYGLSDGDYEAFEAKVIKGIRKGVFKRVFFSFRFLLGLTYIGLPIYNLIAPFYSTPTWLNVALIIPFFLGLKYAQFYIIPLNKIIERVYNNLFFDKKNLSELSNKWQTVINASNLDTARVFTFENSKLSDSKYTNKNANPKVDFLHDKFPVARAVVASTCVPFAFTPVTIAKVFYKNSKDYEKINPRLIDGGIYDNQGIHKLTQKNSSSYCGNVIVSDAGRGLDMKKKFRNQISLLTRTNDVFMERIKNVQMMNNLYSGQCNHSIVAYQSLSFDLDHSLKEFIKMLRDNNISPEVTEAHGIKKINIDNGDWDKIERDIKIRIGVDSIVAKGCSKDELAKARAIKTGLSGFKQWKIDLLIKHAQAITELQIKLFLPHII
jgi:NTE family protein